MAAARVLLLVVLLTLPPADLDKRLFRTHHEQEDGPRRRRDGLVLDRAPHVEPGDELPLRDRERRIRRWGGRGAVLVVVPLVFPESERLERDVPPRRVAEHVDRVVLDRRAEVGQNLILGRAPLIAAAL